MTGGLGEILLKMYLTRPAGVSIEETVYNFGALFGIQISDPLKDELVRALARGNN